MAAAVARARRRPRDPDARFFVGCARLEAEQFAAAEQSFRRALALQRRLDVRRRLGCHRLTRERLRTARRGVELAPLGVVMRAVALIRLRRPREAHALLNSVPVVGPESFNKFYYLGLCALAEGRRFEAMGYLRHALQAFGADTVEMCLPELMAWARRTYVA
jgi:tetratricopeptide (TPR) repeat protein